MRRLFRLKNLSIVAICSILCICNFYGQNQSIKLLDTLINRLNASNKTMGCLLVSKTNSIIYSKCFGYSSTNGHFKTPNNLGTRYLIGSATKMYTAVLIYQLIEEGKISLDDKANKYIKEIKSNTICIKHLLNHSSGLYDYVNDAESDSYLIEPVSRMQIIKKIGEEDLYFKPGTKTKYCNSGYLLLAVIVEKVEGKSFAKSVEARVLDKIEIKNTFCPSFKSTNFNQAQSYDFNIETQSYKPIKDYNLLNITGVGDLISNVEDMSKFIISLNQGILITNESLNIMKTTAPKTQFGSGIMKIEFNDKIAYGHGGDTKGTHSGCYYFPHDSLSVVYYLNSPNYLSNNFAIDVLSILFNDTSYSLPNFQLYVDNSIMKEYFGAYKNEEEGIELNIKGSHIKPSVLIVSIGNEQLFFEPLGKDSFKNWKYDQLIKFKVDSNSFSFHQSGIILDFKRVESQNKLNKK